MNELREDIVAGRRSFGDVARALSEDATAQEGGDLGWVSAGQFVPEFETVMNGLSAGEVSRPVLSRFGMHLIEVIDRRSAEVDPQALREQVSNQMRSQQFEREYAEWVKELRLRAFIDLRENER
jgi:peptidyl-prolyl cis-trans isomerase SurA